MEVVYIIDGADEIFGVNPAVLVGSVFVAFPFDAILQALALYARIDDAANGIDLFAQIDRSRRVCDASRDSASVRRLKEANVEDGMKARELGRERQLHRERRDYFADLVRTDEAFGELARWARSPEIFGGKEDEVANGVRRRNVALAVGEVLVALARTS